MRAKWLVIGLIFGATYLVAGTQPLCAADETPSKPEAPVVAEVGIFGMRPFCHVASILDEIAARFHTAPRFAGL